MCIRLAFSIELRLRVSRLLRSLTNNESHEEDHEGSLLHTPQDSKGGQEEQDQKDWQKKPSQSLRWGHSPSIGRSIEFTARFKGPPSGYIPLPGRFAPLLKRFATTGRYDPLYYLIYNYIGCGCGFN